MKNFRHSVFVGLCVMNIIIGVAFVVKNPVLVVSREAEGFARGLGITIGLMAFVLLVALTNERKP